MKLAQVAVERRGDTTVVRIEGEVDLSNADAVRSEIIAAAPHGSGGIVLDLTATTYLDSSGIRLLFDVAERLHSRRQRIALVVTEAALVRRMLVLTKLDDAVPLHDDLDGALAAIALR